MNDREHILIESRRTYFGSKYRVTSVENYDKSYKQFSDKELSRGTLREMEALMELLSDERK